MSYTHVEPTYTWWCASNSKLSASQQVSFVRDNIDSNN